MLTAEDVVTLLAITRAAVYGAGHLGAIPHLPSDRDFGCRRLLCRVSCTRRQTTA
jgi:hypothetical protein